MGLTLVYESGRTDEPEMREVDEDERRLHLRAESCPECVLEEETGTGPRTQEFLGYCPRDAVSKFDVRVFRLVAVTEYQVVIAHALRSKSLVVTVELGSASFYF